MPSGFALQSLPLDTSAYTRKKRCSEDLVFCLGPEGSHEGSGLDIKRFVCLVKLKCKALTRLSRVRLSRILKITLPVI